MARAPMLDTRDIDGPDGIRQQTLGPDGRPTDNDERIAVISSAGFDDYAKELAFMEETLEIEVHESGDPTSNEPILTVYVNGTPQMFERGRAQKVKRKFVQVLATCRPENMRTETMVQGNQVINKVMKTSSLRYPFTVIDDTKAGREWLRRVVSQRA